MRIPKFLLQTAQSALSRSKLSQDCVALLKVQELVDRAGNYLATTSIAKRLTSKFDLNIKKFENFSVEIQTPKTGTVLLSGDDFALKDPEAGRYLLWFHGGAFAICSATTYRPWMARLGLNAEASVFCVDYRRAPVHVWPRALNDCVKTYRWMLEDLRIPAERIVVGGDSAGGNLAVTSLMKATKQMGLPSPAAMVLVSPWLDLTSSGPSYEFNKEAELVLPPEAIPGMVSMYIRGHPGGEPGDPDSVMEKLKANLEERGMPFVYSDSEQKFRDRLSYPLVSPALVPMGPSGREKRSVGGSIRAETEKEHDVAYWFKHLPPSLVHVAGNEVLLSDSLMLAGKVNSTFEGRLVEERTGGEATSGSPRERQFVPRECLVAGTLHQKLEDGADRQVIPELAKLPYGKDVTVTAPDDRMSVTVFGETFHNFHLFDPIEGIAQKANESIGEFVLKRT